MHPDECAHGNTHIEGVNECVICQRDALKVELASVRAENGRLADWKMNILNVIKSTPEYDPGEWAGDKEGWGYCFEMVAYSLRERQSLVRFVPTQSALRGLRIFVKRETFGNGADIDDMTAANKWLDTVTEALK